MKRLVFASLALVLAAAACGSSSDGILADADAGTPATLDTPDAAAGGDESGGPEAPGEFSAFERGVVDGIVSSGLTRGAAECVVRELRADDVDLLSLAASIDGGELPDALWNAALACGDELDLGGLGGGGVAEAYGDDPELDALWDSCAAGELGDCDELYLTSPFGSDYEAFGGTCGETAGESFGGCSAPSSDADRYGDDADLDALWDGCSAGDGAACDELFWTSPIDSAYEAFGASCGERSEEPTAGQCEEGIGLPDGGAASTDQGYGDDPDLDALWDACGAGDGAACDRLFFESPVDSAYEAFGDTCGNRFPQGVFSCEAELGAG